jgi:putative ABC transport system permease protein
MRPKLSLAWSLRDRRGGIHAMIGMLGHYLSTTVSSLARHKGYTLINLFGLVTGLAACLILMLYVRHELNYDGWLPDADRVHQLQLTLNEADSEPVRLQMAPYPAAAALAAEFPEIEASAGAFTARPVILQEGVATLPDRDALMADAAILDVLALPFVRGDRRTALARADAVVLSESEAVRRFGSADAVGLTMTIIHRGVTRDAAVTGVFADLPGNSHLRFPMVFRLNPSDYADAPGLLGDWSNISGYVYVKLRPDADAARINDRLGAWARRRIPEQAGQVAGNGSDYRLLAVSEVHLGRNQVAAMTSGTDMSTIAAYGLIGVLILAIACFNFINLATARATQRAREVGIRKVLGASRRQLVFQFLTETLIMVIGAMLLALALVEILLPVLDTLLGVRLTLDYFGADGIWLPVVALVAAVSLGGALYPAFHLSRFKPAKVLKANSGIQESPGSGRLRSALALLQFAIVIGLTVCTAVIYAQTRYAQSRQDGYARQGLLKIDHLDREPVRSLGPELVRRIGAVPGVTGVARTSIAPGSGNVSVTEARVPGRAAPVSLGLYQVDDRFFATMGTRVLAGRGFDERRALDDSSLPAAPDAAAQRRLASRGTNVVASALAVRRLGFASPAAAIGSQVELGFIDPAQGRVPATIVGVVEDVRYRSVRTELEPILYRLAPAATTGLVVRISAEQSAAVAERIRALWQARAPEVPFEAVFVEDAVAGMYARDAARGRLFALSSLLAILIGCLGLFGLAAYMTERRIKEIALRKLFGARVPDIVRLLLWQFSRPVLFANLIAWPVAWWAMRAWLDGFSERIGLSPAFFLGAGLLTLLIALATVFSQVLRVGRMRLIEALRYE